MSKILITGASRGIGLHLTKHLLLGGKTVYATCRDPNNALSLQELKKEYSEKLTIETLVVNDDESIKSLVEKLINNKCTFNVLINNAGIYSTMQKETLLNSTKASMLGTFEVNCVAPMLITQHLYNAKLLEHQALIVNISSAMGSIQGTTQAKRGVSYCCSKAALNMFTKMVSIELPGVHSLSVHPGWVETDMGGEMAPLKPDESASGIVKLIDNFNPKTQNGAFLQYDGSVVEW